VAKAKALCATCPVREQCLEAGMGERWGVFGGLTAGERYELRRSR
jgi:Transcription factor WhiB